MAVVGSVLGDVRAESLGERLVCLEGSLGCVECVVRWVGRERRTEPLLSRLESRRSPRLGRWPYCIVDSLRHIAHISTEPTRTTNQTHLRPSIIVPVQLTPLPESSHTTSLLFTRSIR